MNGTERGGPSAINRNKRGWLSSEPMLVLGVVLLQPGKDFARKIAEGTFALQAHDPKSVVRYKNIRVKRL